MSSKKRLFPNLLDDAEWTMWPAATRLVWFTLIAMADKNGEIDACVPAVANRARVPIEQTQEALQKMQEPNPLSRYADHQGRTLEKTARGWRLLQIDNYWK